MYIEDIIDFFHVAMRPSSSFRINGINIVILILLSSKPAECGPFTIASVQPTACTACTFSFSTSTPMPTGALVVEFDENWGMGPSGQVWTFSGSDGVTLKGFATGGGPDEIKGVQNKDGSWSLTSNGGWI